MDKYHAKDLFQLQSELVQMKVDMAVNKSIDRVVEQITNLRYEMHTDLSSLKNEVIAIETKLGMVNARRKGWYDRIMDNLFKTGWAWLSLLFAYLIIHVK
jgi:hypothetical protein